VTTPHIGAEIFPDVDAPLLRIRLRAPAGTRVEESERQVLHALEVIRRDIGAEAHALGAAMHAALKWAQRLERGNVVVMFADSGCPYPMVT